MKQQHLLLEEGTSRFLYTQHMLRLKRGKLGKVINQSVCIIFDYQLHYQKDLLHYSQSKAEHTGPASSDRGGYIKPFLISLGYYSDYL